MSGSFYKLTAAVAALALGSCANAWDPQEGLVQVQPDAGPGAPEAIASAYPTDQVERGRYLVDLLGCGGCHTDGALVGQPDPARLLAGSEVGIAFSNPLEEPKPGVVYPSNLTPDPATGLGDWSVQQITTMLQSGREPHGSQSLPVMPWVTYSKLQPADATAIAMYLKSLPPVTHEVPVNVKPGRRAKAPYVHFGIYRSRQ
jgi:hypothetical protein